MNVNVFEKNTSLPFGFVFKGNENNIQCKFCKVEFIWDKKVGVNNLHKKISKFCPSLLKENYSSYSERIKTLENWNGNVSKTALAMSGFVYTGIEDIVKCHSCNLELKQWDKSDSVSDAHAKFSKNCIFVENSKYRLECDICVDNNKDICFLPCAHVCCCSECAAAITSTCPICNSVIKEKLKIFF